MSGRIDRLVTVLGWLGYLPAPVLAVLGYLCGLLLVMPLAGQRRQIVRTNLRLCYPKRSGLWRTWLLLRHFTLLGRFALDYTCLLSESPQRLKRRVRLVGVEHLRALQAPVILAVPHFFGIDHGAARLNHDMPLAAVYQPQHSILGQTIINKARTRLLSSGKLISTLNSPIRAIVQCLQKGEAVYYLSDMDFRAAAKHVFVPFLGMPTAATLTTLPRLARLTGAVIVPCVTRMRLWGDYEVHVGKPWQDYPSGDDTADTHRFNEFVAAEINRSPAQYYWVHRRFKTQPAGSPAVYD